MQSTKYYILVFLLILLVGHSSTAFAQDFGLTTTYETYMELQQTIPVSDPAGGTFSEAYEGKIPFEFELFDRTLDFEYGTGISIYRDGYIVDNNLHGLVVGPFYALLKRKDNSSSIVYQLDGTAPNRILKFQWKNMGLVNHASTNFVNFQLWLYEKNNVISVHIGPHEVNGNGAFLAGYAGPEIGLYRYDPNAAYYPDKQELVGDPDFPEIISTAPDQALDEMPKENTLYTFYPPGVSVSIQELSDHQEDVIVFPNPARNYFYIDAGDATWSAHELGIELYDMVGKRMDAPIHHQGKHLAVDVSGLSHGLYQCRITQGAKTTLHKIAIE